MNLICVEINLLFSFNSISYQDRTSQETQGHNFIISYLNKLLFRIVRLRQKYADDVIWAGSA